MAQIQMNLPSINGEIEAGITIGVDASLPDDKKLPILYQGADVASINMVKINAAVWAYREVHNVIARRLFVNGVCVAIDMGLICEIGGPTTRTGIPDGDWRKIVNPLQMTQDEANLIKTLVTVEDMKEAIAIMVATKANWWLMNHHIGQGAVQCHVKKILEVFYPMGVTDQLVTVAHNLGHFASTLKILKFADKPNLREVYSVIRNPLSNFTLTQGAKLKFSSLPAGTHRLAISYESAKRLVRSIYAKYCPNVRDFSVLPALKARVDQNPTSFHIRASYLTGVPRADYSDTDCEHFLGRLGTFITTLYKNATVAKSPHLVPSKVESYEDYDADFKSSLIRIQQAQAVARGKLTEEQVEALRIVPEAEIAELRQVFLAALN